MLARPLSAGSTMMDSSSFKRLRVSCVSFVMLGSGGSTCWRILLTALLTVSACSALSCLVADSTLGIISVARSPFFSRAISASSRDLEDKLITHNIQHINWWCSRLFLAQKFIKFLLMSAFGGVKDSLGVGLELFYYPVGVICRESVCYTLCCGFCFFLCISLGKEAESTAQSITSTLLTNDTKRVIEQFKTNTQRVFSTTKGRHKQKFDKLLHKKQATTSPIDMPYVDKTKWVINLSSRSLDDAEMPCRRKDWTSL